MTVRPPSVSGNNEVLKLAAGSHTQVELPFTGLNDLEGVAVDTAGNVYVADFGKNRVLNYRRSSASRGQRTQAPRGRIV